MLGHKSQRCTNTATSSQERWTRANSVSDHNLLEQLCSTLVQLVNTFTALKIVLLYVQGCEKRKLKRTIMDQSQNRIEILFFINLNIYPICRAFVKPRASIALQVSIDSQLSSQLSSFNEQHFLHLNLGQTCMALLLDLETWFLEILTTSQIYPITSKVRFVKKLANYTKQ